MSMRDLEIAIQRVNANPKRIAFAGPKPESLIAKAEVALGISFPPTYRRFLKEYGAGNFGSFEVYGVTTDNFETASVPNGIWFTLAERKQSSLPPNLVVIGDDGHGGLFCLDCSEEREQGAQVILYKPGYSPQEQSREVVAQDFATYFLHGVSR